MNWILANPAFAWLLPAAGLPVLFHLFFKLKKRPRVFPTLMFFEQIDPQLSARRQIRQWLVLLARTLFLLFLLLALARPMWLAGGGGGSVAVVCVIDNSGSMAGNPLKNAVEAARALAGNLDEKDSVGVVTLVDDPTVVLPTGFEADRSLMKAVLDRIVPTEAGGEPGAALQRAFAMLESSAATRFEIHVFTDLQANEWNRVATGLKPPRAGTTLVIHRVTPAPPPNLAITAVKLPAKKLLAGRAVPLQVHVANSGDTDATARLTWSDDADEKGTVEITVPRQTEKTHVLVTKPGTAGFHWLQLVSEPGNKAALGFFCSEKSTVLFVGQPNEFGFLPLAMSPAAEGALSGLVPAFGAVADVARIKPVLVVAPWDQAEALRPYVEQGGNLLAVPGNSLTVPAWLGATPATLESAPKGSPVLLYRANATIFADLRDENGQVPLRSLKAFKFHPLRAAEEQDTVFGLDDGRPLFVECRLGQGIVYTSGVAFDSAWTTLPLKGAFLAIAQSMALAHSGTNDQVTTLVAGERLPPGGNDPLEITTITGSPLEWKGEAAHPPVFPRAGVYRVGTRYVTVRGADRECVARFIAGDEIPVLAGLNYSVRNLGDAAKAATHVRRGMDLFLPLLLAALAMLALEAWLANPLPRKYARGKPVTPQPLAEAAR